MKLKHCYGKWRSICIAVFLFLLVNLDSPKVSFAAISTTNTSDSTLMSSVEQTITQAFSSFVVWIGQVPSVFTFHTHSSSQTMQLANLNHQTNTASTGNPTIAPGTTTQNENNNTQSLLSQQQLPQGLTLDNLSTNVIDLLHNSSFEQQSNGAPRDWNYQLDSNTGNTFISAEGNRSGSYGLKFLGGGTGNFGISQPNVKTIPERTYTFSLYIKITNVPSSTILRFGFWNEYLNQEGQMKVVSIPTTEDWTRYSFTTTTPGLITDPKNEFPLIEVEGLTSGAVYLDDLSLTEGSISVTYNTNQAYNTSYGIGDGSIIFTPESDIYPAYPGEGQLGTDTNQFESLKLTNASIDSNGNFLFKGGGTINGGLTVGTLTVNGSTLFSSTQSALPVANGGTGTTSFTQYGVLYGNGTNAIQALTPGTSGYILQSNGTNTPPSWVAANGLSAGSVAFSGITSGTNTQAAMVVGSGASLNYNGTGTINATTVNGLTIASGKTLTVNNLLTLAGTDGTTMTFPSTSDTIVGRSSTDTLTNKIIAAGSNTITGLTNSNLSGTAGITNANLANSSLTVTAGTGLSGGGLVSLGGSVTLSNSGVLALTGTAHQVIVSASTGNITLSLPQSISTDGSPTFSSLNLTSASNQLVLDANGTLTWTPTAARTLTLPDTTDTLIGKATTDTLTNKTIAAGNNTISGLSNSNLSGSAGITNANLANSSLTVTAGSGLSGGGLVSLGNSVSLNNAGVLSLAGTTNQVNVSGSTGNITLSTPQSIGTGSSPSFASLNLTNASNQLVLDSNGTLTWTPTSARSITIPDAGGTVAVSATSPITLSGAGAIGCSTCLVSSGSLFTLAGTSGSNQTVSQGNTLTIAAGTNITTTGAAGPQVTIAIVNNPTFSTSVTSPLHIGGTGASSNLTLESTSGTGTSDYLAFLTGSQIERARFDTNGKFGFNTTTPLALFSIRGNGSGANAMDGTIAVASISGQSSFANLVVDQSGVGDIFTASASGATRLRITNTGSTIFQGNSIEYIGNGASGNGSNAVINGIGDQGSLVPNGGFEQNLLGGFADGWIAAATNSATITNDTSTVVQGNASVRITMTNSSTAIYSSCFPISGLLGGYSLNYYQTGTSPFATVASFLDTYTSQANCQSDTSPTVSNAAVVATTTSSWVKKGASPNGLGSTATWGRVHFFITCTSGCTNSITNIDGVRFTFSATNQGLDYAENYPANPYHMPHAGDVVALTSGGHVAEVATASKFMDQNVIGVVSSNPGEVLDDGSVPDPKVPVALAGRVPVRVSNKNGPISVGDYLTSSDIPGVAVKATQPGPVIGKALEDDANTDTGAIGTITMFMNISYIDPTIHVAITSTGDLSVNGISIGTNATSVNSTIPLPINASLPNTQNTSSSVSLDQFNSLTTSVVGLQNQIASLSAQLGKIDDLSKQLADLQKTVNLNQLLSGISTQSAGVNALPVNSGDDMTVNGKLNVLGRTVLTDLGITGVLNTGLLTINGLDTSSATASATLNTVTSSLRVQSLAAAGIDFENGKVTIDTNGNIVVSTDITSKTIHADEATFGKINIKDNGDNATTGEATIPAGQTSVEVKTTAVTNKAQIFTSPYGIIDFPLGIITKQPGKSFTVGISKPTTEEIRFGWWVIN